MPKFILGGTITNLPPDFDWMPHNYTMTPYNDWIVAGFVRKWCKDNPMPEVFDPEDSYHFAIAAMHHLLQQLKKRGASS